MGIYGTGKVALSIGFFLKKSGFEVGYFGRSIDSVQRYLNHIGALTFVSADEMLLWCDAVGFLVSDRAVAAVSRDLVSPKTVAFHMSGALTADEIGGVFAARFSLHPLRAFAKVETDISGTTFALEIHESTSSLFAQEIDRFANEFGRVIRLHSEDKVLYHASAVAASNFLVPLMNFANLLLRQIGIDDETLLWPLVETAIINMRSLGIANALTGPVARGDAEVIEKHCAAIKKRIGDIRLYCLMTEMALAFSGADDAKKAEIVKLLKEQGGGNEEVYDIGF